MTAPSLVEEVARALYEDEYPPDVSRQMDWERRDEMIREDYRGHARAAIAVVLRRMEGPSGGMDVAGGEAQSQSIGSWGEPKVVWRAMLAAFRKENSLPPPPTGEEE